MQAALEVFGEAGVAAATLDQIAHRAGVSKGTIYLYFATKEDVFRQAIRQALAPLQASQDLAVPGSPSRQLLDTISRQWAFLTSPIALTVHRLVHAEQWQFPELAELYAREVVSRFGEETGPIIRRGIQAGEFREVDPALAARMLTALAIQNALWWETEGSTSLTNKSSEAVLRELTDFYLQAIALRDAAFPQADGA
jgi:AcrR family transcriptional regulator